MSFVCLPSIDWIECFLNLLGQLHSISFVATLYHPVPVLMLVVVALVAQLGQVGERQGLADHQALGAAAKVEHPGGDRELATTAQAFLVLWLLVGLHMRPQVAGERETLLADFAFVRTIT